MVLNINKSDWFKGSSKNENRRIRWDILEKLGASDNEKRRIRDWNDFNRVKNYTIQPTVRRRRVSYAIKGTNNKKQFWRQLSKYWQYKDGDLRKASLYAGWNPWQKKASEQWNNEAIKINKKLWENMSSNEKKLLKISDVESHSQGYVAVYRHYVIGRSWENSMRGLEITPWEDPYEDVS